MTWGFDLCSIWFCYSHVPPSTASSADVQLRIAAATKKTPNLEVFNFHAHILGLILEYATCFISPAADHWCCGLWVSLSWPA